MFVFCLFSFGVSLLITLFFSWLVLEAAFYGAFKLSREKYSSVQGYRIHGALYPISLDALLTLRGERQELCFESSLCLMPLRLVFAAIPIR